MKWSDVLRSRRISVDGPDGCGKTTVVKALAARLAAEDADLKITQVREPGGTVYGERIRALVLDPSPTEKLNIISEMLLFAAASHQLRTTIIRPAMAEGLVISDRGFLSARVYQGALGNLDIKYLDCVYKGTEGLWRELTDLEIVLLPTWEIAQERMWHRGAADTRFDRGEVYWKSVRDLYVSIAEYLFYPALVNVEAIDTVDDLVCKIMHRLKFELSRKGEET